MEIDGLNEIRSFSDAAKKFLGISYYNGRVKRQLVDYFDKDGIDIVQIIKNNAKIKPIKCLQCGEKFVPKYKGNVFCSLSCAAKYNNVRRGSVSEETKKKISETLLKQHYGENWKEELSKMAAIKWKDKNGIEKIRYIDSTPNCTCKVCDKKFFSRKKDAKYCSPKCMRDDLEYHEKMRDIQLELIKEGKHKGWQSRNIESYPEKFWKKVLDSNSIAYTREDFSTNKYFLDFLIEKNGKKVDLEIDGKQHKYRKEHDAERDRFLTENGFKVYRIEWNSINNEKGKEKMREKIDEFVNFYNSL